MLFVKIKASTSGFLFRHYNHPACRSKSFILKNKQCSLLKHHFQLLHLLLLLLLHQLLQDVLLSLEVGPQQLPLLPPVPLNHFAPLVRLLQDQALHGGVVHNVVVVPET